MRFFALLRYAQNDSEESHQFSIFLSFGILSS
jgi:hypothetical protein